MTRLPDVLMHLLLMQLQIPIELRAIIIEDYFPFLPNEVMLLEKKDLMRMRYCLGARYRDSIDRNYVVNILKGGRYFLEFTICKGIMDVRILYDSIITDESHLLFYKQSSALDESMKLQHPDISFTQTSPKDFAFQFQVLQMKRANVESVRLAIHKWYRKIVLLSIYQNEDFGLHW